MASHYILSYLFLLTLLAIQVAQSTRRVERQATGTGGYPTYSSIPGGLSFSCFARIPGYYADTEADCQVWHWCHPDGQIYSFLCPGQTRFNQIYRACDWHYNVDCPASPDFYNINEDLHKIPVPSNGDNETQNTLMLPKTDEELMQEWTAIGLAPCKPDHVFDNSEGKCVPAYTYKPVFV